MFPGLARPQSLLSSAIAGAFFFVGVLIFFPLSINEPTQALALAIVGLAAIPVFLKALAQASPRAKRLTPSAFGTQIGPPPVFSIHVAIHDEPPDVVIETLESLLRLDYPSDRFEVIVLDNNTPSEAVWQPVEEWCAGHGPNLRFFHHEGVEGAKAGALNLALGHSRADASLIASVDADYQVGPDFLNRAASALRDKRLTHVQFPQAYRDVGHGASAVEAELRQYFGSCARLAHHFRSVLLTGTLSVIRRSALQRVGGWPTDTITEDARLGSLLLGTGGRGLLLDETAGRGLLPSDLTALSRQRQRWAAGNAQTLRQSLSGSSQGRSLPVVIQLAAWLSASWLLLPLGLMATLAHPASSAGSILLGGFLILTLLEPLLVITSTPGSLSLRTQAAMVRLALLPEGTLGLACGLGFRKLCFIRTFKGGGRPDTYRRTRTLTAAGLTVVALALGAFQPLAGCALILAPATLAARSWVSRRLAVDMPTPSPSHSTESSFEKFSTSIT